jgi:hypothetical protein
VRGPFSFIVEARRLVEFARATRGDITHDDALSDVLVKARS